MKTILSRAFLCLTFLFSSSLLFAQKNQKEIQDVYDFDYTYKLKMTTKKDEVQFDYYLKKDADYFGFLLPMVNKGQEGMEIFTVMDNNYNVSAMFMEIAGRKILQKTNLKLDDIKTDEDNSNFTIKEIGSKNILGYNCQGFIAEDKDSHVTIYITNEAPISFNKVWDTGKNKMPKGFDPEWVKKYSKSGLVMEMHYVDKKKPKNNTSMNCIGLDKTDFSINTSDYGSMLGAFGR